MIYISMFVFMMGWLGVDCDDEEPRYGLLREGGEGRGRGEI